MTLKYKVKNEKINWKNTGTLKKSVFSLLCGLRNIEDRVE